MKEQKLKISIQLNARKAEKKLILLFINLNSKEKKMLVNKKELEEWEEAKGNEEKMLAWAEKYPVENKEQFNESYYEKLNYKPIVVSTRLTLPEKFFDRETKLCVAPFEHYNEKIKGLIKSINLLYESLKEVNPNEAIDREIFKAKINEYIFSSEATEESKIPFKEKKKQIYKKVEELSKQKKIYIDAPTNFVQYIEWKINDWKRNDPRSSYRFYNRFKNWVVKFQDKVLGGKQIDLLSVQISDLKQFKEFILNSKTEKGEDFTLNGVNAMIQGWKTFLNEAKNEDEIPFEINLKKRFLEKKTEEEDDIALTKNQIESIKALKFDADEQPMENVRDLFLIGTCCGYRYSDLRFVKLYERNGEHIFKTTNEKTNFKVEVPILRGNEFAIAIFKKYEGKIPAFSPEYFNEQIKFIALRAGVNDKSFHNKIEVAKINPKTTKSEKNYFAIHQLISTKTCRKTFCTLLIEEHELPLPICMSLSGHKTEKSFRNYVRIAPQKYHELALKWQKMQEQVLLKAV
jgi:integrase